MCPVRAICSAAVLIGPDASASQHCTCQVSQRLQLIESVLMNSGVACRFEFTDKKCVNMLDFPASNVDGTTFTDAKQVIKARTP